MDEAVKVIQNRARYLRGVDQPLVQKQDDDKILVELPGVVDKKEAIETISDASQLRFFWLKDVKSDRNPGARWDKYTAEVDLKTGEEIFTFEDTVTHEVIKGDTPTARVMILKKVVNAWDPKTNPTGDKPLLSGEDIKPNCHTDIITGKGNIINIEFNDKGTDIFRTFTQRHIGDIVAIFLGDRILTAPRVEDPITNGRAIITGFKTNEDAAKTADFLNSGVLSVPLTVVSIDSLAATLHKRATNKTILAGVIGLLLVLLFVLFIVLIRVLSSPPRKP
jgi:protein-export membrane protein SecD